MLKAEGRNQVLDRHCFDVAFGGARRDEEKSRAKERIFSFRTASHGLDPKQQRPELWNLYNARKAPRTDRGGESIRVFPIRSDERRVGKERVSPCRSRWSPSH